MGEYRRLSRSLGGGAAFQRCSLDANELRVPVRLTLSEAQAIPTRPAVSSGAFRLGPGNARNGATSAGPHADETHRDGAGGRSVAAVVDAEPRHARGLTLALI